MTRVFFTKHGLKVMFVSLVCILLGFTAVGGFIAIVAAHSLVQALVGAGLMLPGVTVLTAGLILNAQEEEARKEAASKLTKRTRRELEDLGYCKYSLY